MFCCTLLYVPSSFATILMGKRELVALLSLSFWCLVIVVWLFLAVPWICLQFVIVVFTDHTHLLFWYPFTFYDRAHQFYDASLLTGCHTQHARRHYIISEVNQLGIRSKCNLSTNGSNLN